MNKLWQSKNQQFRASLKSLRLARGLKQRQLAELIGKHQSYISKYERGERKLDFIETIEVLDAMGVYELTEFAQTLISGSKAQIEQRHEKEINPKAEQKKLTNSKAKNPDQEQDKSADKPASTKKHKK